MIENNENLNGILENIQKSNFRSKFHLSKKDIEYINEKGIDKITEHAYDLIKKRLAPTEILNDGRQTPMKGHPVFVAQHATATCCRGCLNQWHNISKGHDFSDEELEYVVSIIMTWIKNELKNKK